MFAFASGFAVLDRTNGVDRKSRLGLRTSTSDPAVREIACCPGSDVDILNLAPTPSYRLLFEILRSI